MAKSKLHVHVRLSCGGGGVELGLQHSRQQGEGTCKKTGSGVKREKGHAAQVAGVVTYNGDSHAED
ncbi:hypothetical protein CRENBAI_012559 [Crenichthys baileyi]|uniref:Uncharacterized protein n=1 Tax=Crenichthys baileyi TaxID=28760 RepID=A0AAV9RFR1_9TELE